MMPIEQARDPQQTTGLCGVCMRGVPARVSEAAGRVYLDKRCPVHGEQRVLIASSAAWYRELMGYPAALKAPGTVTRQVELGCPFDCGACAAHEQRVVLPVIPITSACDLACPICYTINRNDDPYQISLDAFRQLLDVIRRNDPQMKLINLTGGEPTLHPQIREIVALCHEAGIHRITISTHGLRFNADQGLLRDLAALGARVVLSFDSFDEQTNARMIGAKWGKAKLRILDRLEQYDVDTTLIPVIALGVNDHELGQFVELMFQRSCIRSLELHTMTFTGQGGVAFEPESRITPYDVLTRIEAQTAGRIRVGDFVPSPCAHPLCYQTCTLLEMGQGDYLPFRRFMSAQQIRELLSDALYMEPGETMERVLTDALTDLWAAELPEATGQRVLVTLKQLLLQMFPTPALDYASQQRVGERAAKTIYLHSHMDPQTFDTDRVRQCCVGVPEIDGGNIPTCAYNVLYRGRDRRFSQLALPPISALGGGRLLPTVGG